MLATMIVVRNFMWFDSDIAIFLDEGGNTKAARHGRAGAGSYRGRAPSDNGSKVRREAELARFFRRLDYKRDGQPPATATAGCRRTSKAIGAPSAGS